MAADYALMASWTCSVCQRATAVPQLTGTNIQRLAKWAADIARNDGWQIPSGRGDDVRCPSCAHRSPEEAQ
jgi:hypothetical protein